MRRVFRGPFTFVGLLFYHFTWLPWLPFSITKVHPCTLCEPTFYSYGMSKSLKWGGSVRPQAQQELGWPRFLFQVLKPRTLEQIFRKLFQAYDFLSLYFPSESRGQEVNILTFSQKNYENWLTGLRSISD